MGWNYFNGATCVFSHNNALLTYRTYTAHRLIHDLVMTGWHRHLTHWGRDKMDAISQTTFSNAFPWMKIFEFRLKFHWSLFLRVQLTPALVQIMTWRRPGDKSLSEPMMFSLLTHICVTRPQWVKMCTVRGLFVESWCVMAMLTYIITLWFTSTPHKTYVVLFTFNPNMVK